MITAGVDVGTRFIKVCITDGETLQGSACAEMGPRFDSLISSLLKEARLQAQVGRWGIDKIIATGYGGHLFSKAAYTLSESTCAARAAFTLNKDVRSVIDMGGLFISVTTMDENGFVEAHHLNERCAAGSGKFLEMVAEAVEVSFREISPLADRSLEPYRFSNNCAVFAESEIITQVNAGRNAGDILAGVVRSVAAKAAALLNSAGAADEVALVGGLAKVPLLGRVLAESTGRKFALLPLDAQLVAAFGAALIAQGKMTRRRARVRSREVAS
ncbi:MAG: acyl-CoA dehydratase activase [Smithellaceae bacterium]|nr:acyl-CoA dehydratase activase [Smithellaceae bacterium]